MTQAATTPKRRKADKLPTIKPWWKSRTLWFNVIVLMLAAAESQLNILKDTLPGGVYTWLAFVLPVGNAALRLISTTALVLKVPKADGEQA